MNNKKQKIKYFLYARRSIVRKKGEVDEDKDVISNETQKKEIRELATKEGLKIVDTFSETQSAKDPGRPKFNDMIRRISKGEANGILCWKMDRLTRNPIDDGTVRYLLRKKIVKHIRALDKSWYPKDNAVIAAVEFSVAEQQSRDTSMHVMRGLRKKCVRGVRPSLAPLGYKNSKILERGEQEIWVDEERFDLVRKIFDAVLSGKYSVLQVRRMANDEWGLRTRQGNKMSVANIYKILANPFYSGWFEYLTEEEDENDERIPEWKKGVHDHMITQEEYDKVQYMLGKKGKARPKTHIFAYTGLMTCGECGARITCEEKWKKQKNGNVHHYIYYHCTGKKNPNCTQRSIEEKKLEKEIDNFLSRIEIPPEFREWAIEKLKKAHEGEKRNRNTILRNQQKEYKQSVADLDSLLKMRIRGELSAEEYSQSKSELEKGKIQLKESLDNIDKRVDDWLKTAENTLTFAERARVEFQKGGLEKRKEILTVLGSNHLLQDKKLSIQTEKPILLIEKASGEIQRIHSRLEPVKNVGDKQQIKDLYSKNKLLCG